MIMRRSNSTNEDAKQIEDYIVETFKSSTTVPRVEFLDSGLSVLNLAISGKSKNGGWPRGRIINVVGDGSSGKTLLALELAAQCFFNLKNKSSELFPSVKKMTIVYNNIEAVMDFPLEEMYGKEFIEAVEWVNTPTIEEFGRDYGKRVLGLKSGEFLLYFLDSFDSLTSESGLERFEKAAEKNKPEEGSYGTGPEKAKYGSSSFFNNICSLMEGKDATLFIISQVRQNIGVAFGEKYTRAGGKALDFYTHVVVWLAVIEKLKKTFSGEDRVYGIRVKAKVKRNKVWKPFREVDFIALFDYGVDEIGSSIAYYYGPKVKKMEFEGTEYTRDDLIAYIEENNFQYKLSEMCEQKWNDIENAIKPVRKKRFDL